jgi:hypothetical protein
MCCCSQLVNPYVYSLCHVGWCCVTRTSTLCDSVAAWASVWNVPYVPTACLWQLHEVAIHGAYADSRNRNNQQPLASYGPDEDMNTGLYIYSITKWHINNYDRARYKVHTKNVSYIVDTVIDANFWCLLSTIRSVGSARASAGWSWSSYICKCDRVCWVFCNSVLSAAHGTEENSHFQTYRNLIARWYIHSWNFERLIMSMRSLNF